MPKSRIQKIDEDIEGEMHLEVKLNRTRYYRFR
jgi:hypothetical protein